ncbi:MAG TPA: glycosyltransferase [Humibacillus sp.]|nr:glycosyltransferase [Humibacillus sp.]
MTRVLITTTPATGHVNPALPLARRLVEDGHEVTWYTGSAFGSAVTATGADHRPIRGDLDFDDDHVPTPEKPINGGIARLRWDVLNVFLRPVPAWVADIERLVEQVRPDVVVADGAFLSGPIVAERRGLPSMVFSVSPLSLSSVDTAPFGLGLSPSSSALGRVRNRSLHWMVHSLVFAEAQRAAEEIRTALGLPPLRGFFMDWSVQIADRVIHPSIPELEYPRTDLPGNVEFTGPLLPAGVGDFTPPAWWPDVADARSQGRPVVLVTQGTVARDPERLLRPTVTALAGSEALVVATTGGSDPDDVLPVQDRPSNLRLVRFIPFAALLPHTDVMVTNGGFGGVQLALANGVPLVTAGKTEDKMEVNARVAWSGAGVSLRSDTPTAAQVAAGLRTVLGDRSYRDRARELATAYAGYDGVSRAVEVLLELASQPLASAR